MVFLCRWSNMWIKHTVLSHHYNTDLLPGTSLPKYLSTSSMATCCTGACSCPVHTTSASQSSASMRAFLGGGGATSCSSTDAAVLAWIFKVLTGRGDSCATAHSSLDSVGSFFTSTTTLPLWRPPPLTRHGPELTAVQLESPKLPWGV